ncbi:MAG: four helix bundle protein [Candidatus Moraniibacteriota bacterium]
MNDSNFSEPVIFLRLADCYRCLHTRILSFPKASRYSLGMRLEQSLLEIVELGYLAQSKRGTSRAMILNKMDVTLRIFFFHLRLAHDTRCLNDAGYAELSGYGVEIGKMIGGWLKKTTESEETKTAGRPR